MKVEKMQATILEYVAKLVENKLTGVGDMIALRSGDKMVVTKAGVDFAKITSGDVVEVVLSEASNDYKELADIFLARPMDPAP